MKKLLIISKAAFWFLIIIITNVYSQEPNETGTFIDQRDGLEYKWVKIGNQIWMAENLKTLHYADGTPVQNLGRDNAAYWYGQGHDIMPNKEADLVLKNLVEIENQIAYLYSDLDEASSDLDGYIQDMIDRAKGK